MRELGDEGLDRVYCTAIAEYETVSEDIRHTRTTWKNDSFQL